jgi:hypothetical protein
MRSLRVSNHYPFAIRESLHFQLPESLAASQGSVLAVSHSVTGGTVEAHYLPVQADPASEDRRSQAWIDVQLRPGESRVYNFQELGGAAGQNRKTGAIKTTFPSNLPQFLETAGGTLTELVDLKLIRLPHDLSSPPGSIMDRTATGLPALFELVEERHGQVRTVLAYRSKSTQPHEQTIEVRYDLYASGITDIEVTVHPGEGADGQAPLLVAKRIAAPAEGVVTIRRHGEAVELSSAAAFEGPVNWLAWGSRENKGEQAILTGQDSSLERGQHQDGEWLLAAEVGRPIEGGTASRLTYRLLPAKDRSVQEVNEAFIAFVGHQQRVWTDEELHVGFGLDAVQFGVTMPVGRGAKSPARQEEIRRNMRIANALGIDWIRFEGFASPDPAQDYLGQPDGAASLAHLQFLTESARESGLGLFLHFALSPSDARLVAERFGDVIAYYEIDNTDAASSSPWPHISREILAVQPQAVVLLSRPEPLVEGVQAIGRQLTIGANEPVGTIKDAALRFAGQAVRQQKMPVVTDFTAEIDLRQTEEAQANQFFAAYEALLSQRSLPLVFHPSFSHNPGDPWPGHHLLRSDGTPTLNASAFHGIIRQNSGGTHRIKVLEVRMPVVMIRPGETTVVPVTFTNSGLRPLEVNTRLHLPAGLTGDGAEKTITLRPRQSLTVERTVSAAAELAPGFYHLFEEARHSGTVRIGWTYAASRGRPVVGAENAAGPVTYVGPFASFERINLSNIRHVVFGREASDPEVDWARRLGHSLRRVTGTDIKHGPDSDITGGQTSRSHLLLGNQETNPHIARLLHQLPLNPMELPAGEGAVMVIPHPTEAYRFLLVVSGSDAEGISRAASDLMTRWTAHGNAPVISQ